MSSSDNSDPRITRTLWPVPSTPGWPLGSTVRQYYLSYFNIINLIISRHRRISIQRYAAWDIFSPPTGPNGTRDRHCRRVGGGVGVGAALFGKSRAAAATVHCLRGAVSAWTDSDIYYTRNACGACKSTFYRFVITVCDGRVWAYCNVRVCILCDLDIAARGRPQRRFPRKRSIWLRRFTRRKNININYKKYNNDSNDVKTVRIVETATVGRTRIIMRP